MTQPHFSIGRDVTVAAAAREVVVAAAREVVVAAGGEVVVAREVVVVADAGGATVAKEFAFAAVGGGYDTNNDEGTNWSPPAIPHVLESVATHQPEL